MQYSKTIPIKLYSCTIKVLISDSVNTLERKIYKENKRDYEENGDYEGIFIHFDIDKYYVILNKKYNLTINTINHELYHLVRCMANERAIEEEEAQAWLMGYISQEVFNFLKSKGIKIE